MKLGLFLSAHCAPEEDASRRLRQIVEQALAAEELGFSSLHLGHHYLAKSAFFQPLPLAAHLASVTERIRIAFGIYLLPVHNPLAVAEQFATLDVLSNGRIIAGFGVGYREKEYLAFGIPYEERFVRLDESVAIIRALWQGDEVTTSGHFGTLERARVNLLPIQSDGPPIMLGAYTSRGIRRVAEHDATWLAPPDGDEETLSARFSLFRKLLAENGLSLDREYPLAREGFIAESGDRAMFKARDYLVETYRNYRSLSALQGIDFEALVAEHALVCGPDEAVGRLNRLQRELGVTEVILRMDWSGLPPSDAMEAIETVGKYVIPQLETAGDF